MSVEDLETRLAKCEAYMKDADARLDKILLVQEQNAANIVALTKATEGVVEAWVVANGLSKFLKWLSTLAVIGAVVLWLKDFTQ